MGRGCAGHAGAAESSWVPGRVEGLQETEPVRVNLTSFFMLSSSGTVGEDSMRVNEGS